MAVVSFDKEEPAAAAAAAEAASTPFSTPSEK